MPEIWKEKREDKREKHSTESIGLIGDGGIDSILASTQNADVPTPLGRSEIIL
jgi:hypothetical protein